MGNSQGLEHKYIKNITRKLKRELNRHILLTNTKHRDMNLPVGGTSSTTVEKYRLLY